GDDRRLGWLIESVSSWPGPVILLSERAFSPTRPPLGTAWYDVPLQLPPPGVRQRLWLRAAGGAFALSETEAATLAAKFRFTPGRIERTVEAAKRLAAWERGSAMAAE